MNDGVWEGVVSIDFAAPFASMVGSVIYKYNQDLASLFMELIGKFVNDCTRTPDMGDCNRFWRVQLATLETDTRAYRLLLCMRPERDWLSDFEKLIVPVLLQHGLPRSL